MLIDDDLIELDVRNYALGTYTLELIVTDLAGNVTRALRVFALDYIEVMNIDYSQVILDPLSGDPVDVIFSVSQGCDVTVDIYKWPGTTLVATIDAYNLAPGVNYVSWDGRDGAGLILTSGLMHYFVIRASNSSGQQGQFNDVGAPRFGVQGNWNTASVDAQGYNPYANDEVRIEFPVNGWIRAQIEVIGLGTLVESSGIFPPGSNVLFWGGRGSDGEIHEGPFSFYFPAPAPLPAPGIYILPNAIRFNDFRAQAYIIHPIFGQVSGLSYELSHDAVVTVAIQDPNGNHVKTLLASVFQAAGTYGLGAGLIWDGRTEDGAIVSLEGTFTVLLTAVSPVTGQVFERRGVISVFK